MTIPSGLDLQCFPLPMRTIVLVLVGLFIALVAAGSACPTCTDLNYDCVPEGYSFDACPIPASSCPIVSCQSHCEGLLGSAATGACSSSLFTCLCETGGSVAGSPSNNNNHSAPSASQTTTTTGNSVTTNTVTIAALDFSTLHLYGDGTMTAGTGFVVGVIIPAVVLIFVIASIVAYIYPKFKKVVNPSTGTEKYFATVALPDTVY